LIVTHYLKAIVAALISGLGVLLSAVEAAPPIGADDWLKAAIAFLTALIAVWAVPNIPTPAPPQEQ
jgi:hypothetical protein